MKLRPQSGLGDAVFTIPAVAACVMNGVPVTVATEHGDVFRPFGNRVEIEPVKAEQPGFTDLRYRRYGPPYFSTYYPANAPASFGAALSFARDRYSTEADRHWRESEFPEVPYCVYGPPRAAARHKHFNLPEYQFMCAPDFDDAMSKIPAGKFLCLVGKDEKFAPPFLQQVDNKVELDTPNFIDRLSLWELFAMVSRADAVISQISALTAIAGLFDVPCVYLKGRAETDDQHVKHVAGVLWEKK